MASSYQAGVVVVAVVEVVVVFVVEVAVVVVVEVVVVAVVEVVVVVVVAVGLISGHQLLPWPLVGVCGPFQSFKENEFKNKRRILKFFKRLFEFI